MEIDKLGTACFKNYNDKKPAFVYNKAVVCQLQSKDKKEGYC